MFGEFDGAGKPKYTLDKYSIKFNDFAEPRSPHGWSVLRLLGRLMPCRKKFKEIIL